jgi:hypothetical protein
MTQYTIPKYRESGTSWEKQHDAMLDHISYLENKIEGALGYLLKMEEEHPEVAFEIGELYLILFETKIDNDIRRGFDKQPSDVLRSDGTETKEEQE